MFGFECFKRNGIEQLMVNTLNEQMQYHYNQITFANAAYEQESIDSLFWIWLDAKLIVNFVKKN